MAVINGWNLTRFAECMLPLLSDDMDAAVSEAEEALDAYMPAFERKVDNGITL